MRTIWLPVLLGATCLLSSCNQSPAAAALSTQTLTVETIGTSQPTAEVIPTSQPTAKVEPTSAPATCKVLPSIPKPDPKLTETIPPITERDWVIGPADAKITVMEYSDFQCPYCAILSPVLETLAKNNPQDVRFVFRHFPIPTHTLSLLATQATEAAGKQGKFWELHDVIFKEQNTWDSLEPEAFKVWLTDQAKSLGLNTDQFAKDISSAELIEYAKNAQNIAIGAKIKETPTLLINGVPVPSQMHLNSLDNQQAIVKLFLLEERAYKECPPMTVENVKDYSADIKTEKGNIKIQLFADKAPWAVNSFIFLARAGWYDNVMFTRVLPGFVAITGDPSGSGYGGPGYAYSNEVSDLRFDKEGVVALVNSGKDYNGSQFFITLGTSKQLDSLNGKVTIFGQVTEGMDIVKKLTPRDPQKPTADMPAGDKILGITITEK